jgi:hypothetical protein
MDDREPAAPVCRQQSTILGMISIVPVISAGAPGSEKSHCVSMVTTAECISSGSVYFIFFSTMKESSIHGEGHSGSVADSVCLNPAELPWQRRVETFVLFFVESITTTANNQGISGNSFSSAQLETIRFQLSSRSRSI